ncbi:MAG: ferritin-like domain-containing protein [bacterium]
MAMETKEMVKRLSSLVQLDIDAVHSYGQAIDEIDVPSIRQQITQFRDDHLRHINELSEIIRNYGETPPEYSRDIKGFVLEGFTAIRSLTGTEGALKALHANEKITNRMYADARTWDLLSDAKNTVEINYSDEQRHIRYLEEAIENRLWEKK